MVFKQKHLIHDDGLVSMFLGAERATDILGAGHDLAALVVQTQDARHHIRAALRSLQRRRQFLAVADASSFRSLTCGESRSQHAGVSLSGLPTSGGEAGVLLTGEEAVAVSFGDYTFRNEGLLLHPRLCAQGTCHIVQIPHLVPLIGGEGHGSNHTVAACGHTAVDAKGCGKVAG